MRLIDLPTLWTIGLDIVAWLVIHLGVVWLMTSFDAGRFDPQGSFFRPRGFEDEGRLYKRIFDVSRWKRWLPDAARAMGRRGFAKRRLAGVDTAYLERFARETCRAEATHALTMVWAPLFFLWNPVWVGWLMIVYAVGENLPLIIAQRYNRARIQRVLARREARARRRAARPPG